MRRLGQKEDGAIAVMTALLMVVVLGMTALVVDVGMLYFERAQLQNGADAAALAIASDCAKNVACDEISAVVTAATLASANANDGRASSDPIISGNTVTVTTNTLTANGEPELQHWFAPFINVDATDVAAVAQASWGSPLAGFAPFPMTFSTCEVQKGTKLQLIEFHKKSSSTPGCPGGPSGGFGKLDQDSGVCGATVDSAKSSVGSDPGNNVPSNCDALLESWATSIENGSYPVGLFPIYDSVVGNGSKATYGIAGFAAFEVYGWKWKQGGSKKEQFRSNYYSGMNCEKDICLIGKFVKQVLLDDDYTMGPPNEFGVTIVKLTG